MRVWGGALIGGYQHLIKALVYHDCYVWDHPSPDLVSSSDRACPCTLVDGASQSSVYTPKTKQSVGVGAALQVLQFLPQ